MSTDETFIPRAVNQFFDADGIPWPDVAWPNGSVVHYTGQCTCATCAWLLAFVSRGERFKTPTEIRRLTGVHQTPMPFDRIAVVAEQLMGDQCNVRGWASKRNAMTTGHFKELLAQPGVAIGVPFDYEFLRGDSTFDPDFNDDHMMAAIGGTKATLPDGRVTVDCMDPIGERSTPGGRRHGKIHAVVLNQLVAGAESLAQMVAGYQPGRIMGIVVRQLPATQPVPDPTPVDPKDAEILALQKQVQGLNVKLDGAYDKLDTANGLAGQIGEVTGGN